jgi:hypothetical protein
LECSEWFVATHNVGNETVLSEIIVLITTVLFSEIDGDWMKKKKK